MSTLAAMTQTQQRVLELAGLPAGWGRVLGLLIVAGLCAAAIWLYRRERRAGGGRTVRAGLTLVRCLVLLALAGIWLQPVVATYLHRAIPGRVAVLIDGSASMSVADAGTLEAGPDQAAAPPPSRLDQVRTLLTAAEGQWLRRLAERNELSVYVFGDQLVPVAPFWTAPPAAAASAPAPARVPAAEDAAARPAPAPVPIPAVLPVAPHTDVGQALTGVLSDLGSAPLAGIVIFSDGGVNKGPPTDELALLARHGRAPLFPVGVGSPREPPNLRIISAAAPAVVPPGDPFEIRIEAAAAGLPAQQAEIELTVEPAAGGAEQAVGSQRVRLASRPASAPAGAAESGGEPDAGARGTALFALSPPAPGEYTYRARVRPVPGEALLADNVREMPVRVTDERLRVLLVAGGPSYEYQYLTRLLERDKSIDVSCWLQSADERAVREGDQVISRLPREPAELFGYDALLLLDPDPAELDESWAVLVRRWVDEFGGGVLMQAGPHYATRLLRDPRLEELVSILPVTPDPDADMRLSALGTYRTEAVRLELPDSAAGHPLVALAADPAANQSLWAALPGAWWYLPVLRSKPVASVLLQLPGAAHRNPHGPAVLLAAQPVGAGRMVFLGFDSTWRWRAGAEAAFNRFWVQMVRYLAQARRQQGHPRGTIVLDRESLSVGDYVKIEARVLDESFAPLPQAEVQAVLQWQDGPAQPLALRAVSDRPGWFQGRLLLDRAGAARLRIPLPTAATAPGEDGRDARATQPGTAAPQNTLTRRLRVQHPDVELRTLRLREELLSDLARQTGGEYCRLADAGTLPDRIRKAGERKPPQRAGADPLWDRTAVMLALAGLLALEWAVRRRNHLL